MSTVIGYQLSYEIISTLLVFGWKHKDEMYFGRMPLRNLHLWHKIMTNCWIFTLDTNKELIGVRKRRKNQPVSTCFSRRRDQKSSQPQSIDKFVHRVPPLDQNMLIFYTIGLDLQNNTSTRNDCVILKLHQCQGQILPSLLITCDCVWLYAAIWVKGGG